MKGKLTKLDYGEGFRYEVILGRGFAYSLTVRVEGMFVVLMYNEQSNNGLNVSRCVRIKDDKEREVFVQYLRDNPDEGMAGLQGGSQSDYMSDEFDDSDERLVRLEEMTKDDLIKYAQRGDTYLRNLNYDRFFFKRELVDFGDIKMVPTPRYFDYYQGEDGEMVHMKLEMNRWKGITTDLITYDEIDGKYSDIMNTILTKSKDSIEWFLKDRKISHLYSIILGYNMIGDYILTDLTVRVARVEYKPIELFDPSSKLSTRVTT